MIKCGITGKAYDIIKSAYTGSSYRIKTQDGITESFRSNSGVKQGCTLSPTLSNIFQNNLHDIFNESCDPVKLGDIFMNSLSWADDLFLVSQSRQGLQSCLNKLEEYCTKWQLKLNVSKTKIMIMSKGAPKEKPFTFGEHKLETVKVYKYLGMIISRNGNVQKMAEDREKKAKRATFAIKQALSTSANVSVKLALSLYEKQIEPILLYGSPLWAIPSSNCCIRIKYDKFDKTKITSQVKNLLKCMGAENVNILLCRYCKSRDDVLVKLENVFAKIDLMRNYWQSPVTFTMIDNEDTNTNVVDQCFNNYCKFTLGISKYSSSHLALGEVGKFPLSHKAIALTLAYWLRMEHGTEHIMLNKAFIDMKNDNHQWMENVYCLLCKIGLRDVWESPHQWSVKNLKYHVKKRLNDIYQQKYHEYITDSANNDKCHITKICSTNDYSKKQYLQVIKKPAVRSLVTKLRIDSNSTLDCKYRSFRFKSSLNNTCDVCGACDNVEHLLLECKKDSTKNARSVFYNNMCKFVKGFKDMQKHEQIKQILNVNPKCSKVDLEEAITTICKFIKCVYDSR